MLHQYLVFVEFNANDPTGMASLEPRKWLLVLVSNPEMARYYLKVGVEAVSLSEYSRSLNLEVWLEPDRLAEQIQLLRQELPGAVLAGLFIPGELTPALKRLKPAEVVPFPQMQVA